MFAFSFEPTWIWVFVMILCFLIEALTFSLTTIWFALGAIGAIAISIFSVSFEWQMLIFAIFSLLMLIFTRPVLKKHISKKIPATNADSLLGKTVILQKEASPNESGEAKIGGIVWTAKSPLQKIEKGESCQIIEIRGNSLIVKKLE